MKQVFMLDIETTGLDKKNDDVLEVAILNCKWDGEYYVPGEKLDLFLPNARTPANDFAKDKMPWLYAHCNDLYAEGARVAPVEAREAIRDFFESCEAPNRRDRTVVGWNVVNFDLQFLVGKGILNEWDYHYRTYEMSGLILAMMDGLKVPDTAENREKVIEFTKEEDPRNILTPSHSSLPQGLRILPKELYHWGMYDCYEQTKALNGSLYIMKKGIDNLRREYELDR